MMYLAILGASDPEMLAIEKLLQECCVRVVYARDANSDRVHPGNAYRAECPAELAEYPQQWAAVIRVECDWVGREKCVVSHGQPDLADHHLPGDPGFGQPPQNFMSASSLGQVILWLAAIGVLPTIWRTGPIIGSVKFQLRYCPDDDAPGTWNVTVPSHRLRHAQNYRIPHDFVLAAAADHCLAAAYRGECPGVDPNELMAWRVWSRSKFQGVAPDRLKASIEAAREAIRTAPQVELNPPIHVYSHDWSTSVCDGCNHDSIKVVDMRRDTPVPELVEAATRDNVSFLSGPLQSPDGRQKYTCNGTPEVIQAFIQHWAPANGLIDVYGDPIRGFAGGYVVDPDVGV